ncbi:hypothetical protein VR010_10945 [Actinomycetaceae bacterium L2_0104]
MRTTSRAQLSFLMATCAAFVLGSCSSQTSQPEPSQPGPSQSGTSETPVDGISSEPTFAIEWETDDPTLFLRGDTLFVTRGFGDGKELVALQVEIPEDPVAVKALSPIEYDELWSTKIGDGMFAVADDLYESSRVLVVDGTEAVLRDGASGDEYARVELPTEASSLDVETFDSFFVGFDEGDTEQMVLTSTGELTSLEEWVDDFPADVTDYGALHDWVLPAGPDRKGILHIRGDGFRWAFDGTDQGFVDELGFGDDYVLTDGMQGFSDVFLQYTRSGIDVQDGTHTNEDVAVARLDDGELLEVHDDAVLCGRGICSGEFSVVDGVVQPGADVTYSIPDYDDPEDTESPMPDIREFPRSRTGDLPGGEYEVTSLGTGWSWLTGESPLYVRHDDADPLGIGGESLVPCRRSDGAAGAIACHATGEPIEDEMVPMSAVAMAGPSESIGAYHLTVAVTDEHILIAPHLIVE